MNNIGYKVRSAILGHATGDALGVPVEFRSRENIAADPVVGMREYGTHKQPMGTWSDDASMTLAAMYSLTKGVELADIMSEFLCWMKDVKFTATDCVFDIGITTRYALYRAEKGTPPTECGETEESSNGNGSLMRIIPFSLYSYYKMADKPVDEKLALIHDGSALTHAHMRSKVGCGIYSFIIFELLKEQSKAAVIRGIKAAYDFYSQIDEAKAELEVYSRVFGDIAGYDASEIKSSGYVVHTLEAAVWCLLTTDSYAECVLKAVNLGDDTDTVAAVAGGIAGLLYGADGIPAEWLECLKKRDEIEKLCDDFAVSLN